MADREPSRPAPQPAVPEEPLIPQHGGYAQLKSFQLAQLVYDVTVRFCDRNIPRRSRTHDQMVQAARSGVQNIAEGSVASGTSKKMELKLTNVARASLEELRLDYEDFLRQRGWCVWPPTDPRRRELVERRCRTADQVAAWVKEIAQRPESKPGPVSQNGPHGPHGPHGQPCAEPRGPSIGSIGSIGSTGSIESTGSIPPLPLSSSVSLYPSLAANAVLVLIGVTRSLLSRQINAQAAAFEAHGGFTERLYHTRQRHRAAS
ncbi:MAG: four helix bundle protein [Verrucomicrobiales bacterium]|nr:four helix bundle protein [Verrucomicrobiales bacterium]